MGQDVMICYFQFAKKSNKLLCRWKNEIFQRFFLFSEKCHKQISIKAHLRRSSDCVLMLNHFSNYDLSLFGGKMVKGTHQKQQRYQKESKLRGKISGN
jgi:hypothetical protein